MWVDYPVANFSTIMAIQRGEARRRSVSSIQPFSGASSGPCVSRRTAPMRRLRQATIAIAADPSADQTGAPESPLQAPAASAGPPPR